MRDYHKREIIDKGIKQVIKNFAIPKKDNKNWYTFHNSLCIIIAKTETNSPNTTVISVNIDRKVTNEFHSYNERVKVEIEFVVELAKGKLYDVFDTTATSEFDSNSEDIKVELEVVITIVQDIRRPLDPLATELESNPELGCQLVNYFVIYIRYDFW